RRARGHGHHHQERHEAGHLGSGAERRHGAAQPGRCPLLAMAAAHWRALRAARNERSALRAEYCAVFLVRSLRSLTWRTLRDARNEQSALRAEYRAVFMVRSLRSLT